MAQSDHHTWRDDVLSAHEAEARLRTMTDWLCELGYADRMGWITAEQHRTALDELDRYGRVWSAAVARAAEAESEYEAEQAMIAATKRGGLSILQVVR